ncbi:MAG: DNA-3-methyladenine glycosylase I [Rikenellaceae bacterium]
MNRCKWPNLESNPIYIEYHDNEWGVASYDDRYLFEMLILESFHCGLSWLLILKKRAEFKRAFDDFDVERVAKYDDKKIEELMQDSGIVRNRAKIVAAVANAIAFIKVQQEFGSFCKYIWSFTNEQIVYGDFNLLLTTNALSDRVSKDMKRRGFKFMGSVTTYSFLEAIGVMNNHASDCFRYHHNAK